jgi:hypothetical protein
LVEIVELVQTEIGVPAASVKTLGGGGGGAAGEPDDGALMLEAPALPEVIPGLEDAPEEEAPEPGAVLADIIVPAASLGIGVAIPSGVGVGDASAMVCGEVDCEEQPTWTSSVAATNKASRKILFEFIKPFLKFGRAGSLDG